MLDREEYIEQAHFFRTLKSRIGEGLSTQDLLSSVREEILATTKLPMAIDFMAGELKLQGVFGTAMTKLPHYFTPFQSFVVAEAESDKATSTCRWHSKSWPAKPTIVPKGPRPRACFSISSSRSPATAWATTAD